MKPYMICRVCDLNDALPWSDLAIMHREGIEWKDLVEEQRQAFKLYINDQYQRPVVAMKNLTRQQLVVVGQANEKKDQEEQEILNKIRKINDSYKQKIIDDQTRQEEPTGHQQSSKWMWMAIAFAVLISSIF